MADIESRRMFVEELGGKIKEIEEIQRKIESLETESLNIKQSLSTGKKIDPDVIKFAKIQNLKKLKMAECKNKGAKLQYELMKRNAEGQKMQILIQNYENQQKILEKILNKLSDVPKIRETVREQSKLASRMGDYIQKEFKAKSNHDVEDSEERRAIKRLLKENRKLKTELDMKMKEDEVPVEVNKDHIIERLKNAENRVAYLENKMRYYNNIDENFNLFDFTNLNDKNCPYC